MKILFISHDASRTGAPILLLNLLRLLKAETNIDFILLLKDGGPLEEEFSSLCNTFIWNNHYHLREEQFIINRFIESRLFIRREQKRKAHILHELRSAAVIINNTITNGDLLAIIAKGFNGEIITYVHELKMAFYRFATPACIAQSIGLSHKLAVPSQSVLQHLVENYSVPKEKIHFLNYYIPADSLRHTIPSSDSVNEKKMLVVGGCGTLDWRKGIDIFIQVVSYLKRNTPSIDSFLFRWKGALYDTLDYEECMYDIKTAGLEDNIILLPADDDVSSFYESIDLFFLPSREDPYPLVVLEAAYFSKPIVCFESAGGAPEFVKDDAGTCISYLDIAQAAEALLHYQQQPWLLVEKGKVAKSRMRALHQDKSLILQQFNQLIEN